MTTLWLDLETYNEEPIKSGTYKYASSAEITLFAYALDFEPAEVIDLTLDRAAGEQRIRKLIHSADEIYAHNAMFDRSVLNYSGFETGIEQWRCTMVEALAHGLPGGLDQLCEIFNIEEDSRKMRDGRRLMLLFCKPRPKNAKLDRATRETHPEEWAQFVDYARLDIEAMRAVHGKLPKWNYQGAELALWHLDQRINDRGFATDGVLVDAAIRAIAAAQKILSERANEITDGVVEATTQRDRMLRWMLEEHGFDVPDLRSATVDKLLERELPPEIRAMLEIRAQASASSTSKYAAIKRGANDDGRLRGTIQFDGASRTRRAAARGFQPQNLPSRGLMEWGDALPGIEAMKGGFEEMVYDNVMLLATSTIRGCIVAPPGRKLVVADLSNIEGRNLAWLAGEDWKVQAYRDFDAGIGPDLYVKAYAAAFGIDEADVDYSGRQIGKVMELALGYEGGVTAFVTFAEVYGIDLEEMANNAWDTLPGDVVYEAEGFLDWLEEKFHKRFPISRRAATVCEVFKRLWRAAHPASVNLWSLVLGNAKLAVRHPGETITAGKFKFRRDGAWLRIQLPSGRVLCYCAPRIDDDDKLSFMGVNSFTKKWCRQYTYGGKLVENIDQSFSRDIFYDGMPRAEAAGYKIVLHVHDELVTEVPDSPEFNAEDLSQLMTVQPDYAPGLPLAAKGFETDRYHKE